MWYKDGRPLSASLQSHISTSYDGLELTGSTSLDVPSIQRKDSGVYRVVLQGQLGAGTLPQDLLLQETSFQIDVEGESCHVLHAILTIFTTHLSWVGTFYNDDNYHIIMMLMHLL